MSEAASVLSARTDEELVAAFLSGEIGAFEELVQRYSRPIFNFVYRMLCSYADADDVAQDVFVQVYNSLPAARTDLPFKPWLYVIAKNKCLDFLKRKRPLLFSDVDGPEAEDGSIAERVADSDPLPEELAERADLQRILHEAVLGLPERYRQVVAMRYTGDLSFAEIAQALALPENTVKTHFHRAKALLRTRLLDVL
ncbi:MAG TPA: sigma-70 family RNA polymerase sigma factor [Dehalococcoidia bacterium]|nr:sigma-70 family RNA polymerase sigma factor [Dehalococcoidia bacterium]